MQHLHASSFHAHTGYGSTSQQLGLFHPVSLKPGYKMMEAISTWTLPQIFLYLEAHISLPWPKFFIIYSS